jgi:SET domain-containing protein
MVRAHHGSSLDGKRNRQSSDCLFRFPCVYGGQHLEKQGSNFSTTSIYLQAVRVMKSAKMSKTTNPYVKVSRTPTGLGLVATSVIPLGAKIIEYVGRIMNEEEADEKGGMYQFAINKHKTIDGSGRGNIARYANHACRPNAQAFVDDDDEIWIYAIKKIQPGEQITIHYGKHYFDTFIRPKGCKCATCLKKPLNKL